MFIAAIYDDYFYKNGIYTLNYNDINWYNGNGIIKINGIYTLKLLEKEKVVVGGSYFD